MLCPVGASVVGHVGACLAAALLPYASQTEVACDVGLLVSREAGREGAAVLDPSTAKHAALLPLLPSCTAGAAEPAAGGQLLGGARGVRPPDCRADDDGDDGHCSTRGRRSTGSSARWRGSSRGGAAAAAAAAAAAGGCRRALGPRRACQGCGGSPQCEAGHATWRRPCAGPAASAVALGPAAP